MWDDHKSQLGILCESSCGDFNASKAASLHTGPQFSTFCHVKCRWWNGTKEVRRSPLWDSEMYKSELNTHMRLEACPTCEQIEEEFLSWMGANVYFYALLWESLVSLLWPQYGKCRDHCHKSNVHVQYRELYYCSCQEFYALLDRFHISVPKKATAHRRPPGHKPINSQRDHELLVKAAKQQQPLRFKTCMHRL